MSQDLPLTPKEVAMGMFRNEIYLANTEEAIKNSFGMLVMLSGDSEFFKDKVGAYEYYHNASPTSVNGYPIFFSGRFVGVEEMNEILKEYRTIKEILDERL